MAKVNPIPEGYHSVTPYLCIKGANAAIDYYKKAFGAEELFRMDGPGGSIAHAEIKIGNSPIMLSDEHLEMGYKGPEAYGGSPQSLMIYVDDVDTVFSRALEAGGTEVKPLENQFYGDRSGSFKDPFGHSWTVATHIEDLTPEEIEKRMAAQHAPAA